jgi:hypothetical protein
MQAAYKVKSSPYMCVLHNICSSLSGLNVGHICWSPRLRDVVIYGKRDAVLVDAFIRRRADRRRGGLGRGERQEPDDDLR